MNRDEISADEQGYTVTGWTVMKKTRTGIKNLNSRDPTHGIRRKSQTDNGNLKTKIGDPSVLLPKDRTTYQETPIPEAFITKSCSALTPNAFTNMY